MVLTQLKNTELGFIFRNKILFCRAGVSETGIPLFEAYFVGTNEFLGIVAFISILNLGEKDNPLFLMDDLAQFGKLAQTIGSIINRSEAFHIVRLGYDFALQVDPISVIASGTTRVDNLSPQYLTELNEALNGAK